MTLNRSPALSHAQVWCRRLPVEPVLPGAKTLRTALQLMARQAVALLHVLLSWAALCLLTPAQATPTPPVAPPREVQVGEVLPDVPLKGLNGPSRQLASYRGKPLIINVWASWCGPCRQEMGSLERLAWKQGASDFNLIGISTDDYPQAALGFLHKSNATLSHFIDSQLQLESLLGARRLPLTVLVDSQGRIVHKIVGAQEWDSPQALALIAKAFRLPAFTAPRAK